MTSDFSKKMFPVMNATLFAFVLIFFFVPTFVHAAPTPETTSGNTGVVYQCIDGNCDFNDLVGAVQKLIKWGVGFALSFSVVVIAYAGSIYLMSGGSATERARANKMLASVAKGIVLVLAAWLIVTLITSALLTPEAQSGPGFILKN